jgi:hypothetical protein
VVAVPSNIGEVKEHTLAQITQAQVVMARILFSVADVAVLLGQKYGFRIMSNARLFSLAFLPSLLDTLGFRKIRPSAIANMAWMERHAMVAMSTAVISVLPLVIAVELGGRAIVTIHPDHKMSADME